jgi:hypothetical protein
MERLLYLEARILEGEGRLDEATQLIVQLLVRDRSQTAPFLALWRLLRAQDPARALERFREHCAAGPLPRLTLPIAPDPPAAVEPGEGTTLTGAPAILRAGPFVHADPRVRHGATHWQLLRDDAGEEGTPEIDEVSDRALVEYELPPGLLVAGAQYSFRARFRASDGRISPWAGARFAAGDVPWEPVPLDLAAHFDRDVVAAPGDDRDDSFDSTGHLLVEDGFDPAGSGRAVRGLPRDRRIGVHTLGAPDRANAVALRRESAPLGVAVPAGRYAALRLLVSGANGRSRVPLELRFADGAPERREVPCPDWFDDAGREDLGGAQPIRDDMARALGRRIVDEQDPALFEVIIPLPAERTLVAFVLDAAGGTYSAADTRFHLFAATGMRIVEGE